MDSQALPDSLRQALATGQVDLDDPATTLALLKLNAVVGLKGFFNSEGTLSSVGLTCAVCHSAGVAHRPMTPHGPARLIR